jgi:hypothetical protein
MSGGLLAQAQQFKATRQKEQALDPGTGPGNGREAHVKASTRIENSSTVEADVDKVPNQTRPGFLKGTIVGVDCSSPPGAILTVISRGKTWKMQVPDSKHVLVIGGDSFSCSWSRQEVALKYRETGDAAGSVISIEVQ